MLEKDIEQYLRKRIDMIGGLCFKFISNETGVPDRTVIHKGHVFFVELKTAVGKLSPRQKYIHGKLIETGGKVAVLHGKEDVDVFVNFLDSLKDTRDDA